MTPNKIIEHVKVVQQEVLGMSNLYTDGVLSISANKSIPAIEARKYPGLELAYLEREGVRKEIFYQLYGELREEYLKLRAVIIPTFQAGTHFEERKAMDEFLKLLEYQPSKLEPKQ